MLNKGTMNVVMVVGRLGQDPDVRYTQSGSTVCNLSVATSAYDKMAEGNERTEWIKCVCFGKTAEFIGQYAKKGSIVAVDGYLRTNKWQDKDGNTRYTTEVIANSATLVGGRGDAGDGNGGSATSRAPSVSSAADSDIPF